ncbi:LPS O-antigen length regulator Wzz(fepE) [Trabulsiella odontotermitis]|uniref:LPS O-antigen length regulator Wzz(fepE) n=1 Tax=Trabulsiella odontotermitis TaxID=379893 RepID=UPI003AC23C95
MSSLEIKSSNVPEFAHYPPATSRSGEIDLLSLIDTLWCAKRHVLSCVLGFAFAGLLVSFLLPQKWTSNAVITPAESTQWNTLRQTLVNLQVLDVNTSIDRGEAFSLFIKKFRSQLLLEEYIKSTPMLMEQFENTQVDPMELHRAIVAISEKMKAVDDSSNKKSDPQPYSSWTLSFTAPNPQEAQSILDGYIQFVAKQVVEQTMDDVRNALALKTKTEKEALDLERAKLNNLHEAKIKRLNYSLEVAKAAGISKPVFSNGQAVKDDPDFSVSLGADGIARKLEIEKSIADVSELNGNLRNREYVLEQLEKLNIENVTFPVFKYQLSASMPVKKDGPGKSLVVLLAALLGGMVACGGILLRQAMKMREPSLKVV